MRVHGWECAGKLLYRSLTVAIVYQKRPILIVLALAVWFTAVGAGMSLLRTYSLTPAVAGVPGPRWPTPSRIVPRSGYFTLVMTIHPHCPCSRASIGELGILMAHSNGRLAAFVVFVEPPGFGESWTKSDLWTSAGLIPGVTRIIDRGTEAALFGAATSGQTMVYDRRGNLLFSGGLTAARGHYGDNPGVSEIVALLSAPTLAGRARLVASTSELAGTQLHAAVYGCPLFAPSSNRNNEQLKCAK
jgi:hypothetical protein